MAPLETIPQWERTVLFHSAYRLELSQMIVSPNEEQKEKKSGVTQQRQHRPGGIDRLVRY
jgi:hypothetical protein